MYYIVNLSSVITYKIEESRSAFKQLCNTYSKWFWASSCCPTLFNSLSLLNLMWLAWIERKAHDIPRYKLGKMETEIFLEKLCDQFDFLLEKNYPPILINELFAT